MFWSVLLSWIFIFDDVETSLFLCIPPLEKPELLIKIDVEEWIKLQKGHLDEISSHLLLHLKHIICLQHFVDENVKFSSIEEREDVDEGVTTEIVVSSLL